jgi:uncharacterized protein (DUF1330 family)
VGLLAALDLESIRKLYRAELPIPVDVLNLVHFKDENAYKWYGIMVMPLLRAVGGRVGWMGKHVASFLGEPRAEELLVVRYPNQRRFFALALNPYYIAVANPQRLKGVRKFEASFTHSADSLEALRRSNWVLAVHVRQGLEAVVRAVQSAGGERVYQSVETSPIKIAKRDHPANTNPLAFQSTALFRFESRAACEAAMSADLLDQLREAAGELSVQLYRRLPREEVLPAQLAKASRRL